MAELTELEDWERELLESGPALDERQCDRCSRFRLLRSWPLGRPRMLCQPCWLRRVRGDVVSLLLCGELVVFTTHPQRGQELRGAIRAAGIEPGGMQPAIRWQLTGPRQDHDLGTYTGDFVDAQARLLDATADLDQLNPTDEE